MMLDGLLRLRPMQTSDRSCASASYDSSSTGHRIIVGFRAVSAPMASALYVELCQKPGKSLPQFSDAKAVAAHRNSILLRFVFDIAELCCMLGSTCSWRTFKGVPISHAMSQRMDLLCPNPELQYVPLPVKPYKGNCHPVLDGRLEVSAYRSVCVTKDGIRFVDVSPWNIWFYGTPDFSRGLAAITSWKLSKDRSTWVEDGKMTMDEFSALIKDDNLPSTQLEFPIVDIQHPHIIYCAVRGQSDYRSKAQAFILAVDLSKKTVDEHKPFLHCEFSKYVRGTRSMPVVDV
ncbi:hypothetical protein QOZ80_3BG0257380 [Eleusine coracana subsp. coracana]|nr:hypothetical protein QOZ80_3BG0257380 [Eleusine coracana subsp. coracana]